MAVISRHTHVRARSAPGQRLTQRLPRWFLRVPELVFTFRLSRLAPSLVMVTTTGRLSGRPRRVVLDVAGEDGRGLWVLAADGYQARWVKNLQADPRCRIQHRGRRFQARAAVPPPGGPTDDLAAELAVQIYRQRPFYTKLIYLAVGQRIHGERDVRRLSAGVLPVRLEEVSPLPQRPTET